MPNYQNQRYAIPPGQMRDPRIGIPTEGLPIQPGVPADYFITRRDEMIPRRPTGYAGDPNTLNPPMMNPGAAGNQLPPSIANRNPLLPGDTATMGVDWNAPTMWQALQNRLFPGGANMRQLAYYTRPR